ncbi:ATP-binding protein [Nannocystis bainbridge]|uniref:histidine kinase n=1 Tax=Nannocystis bainbridge TaxID=2995303 RepID=A0ABT5E6Q6_9BACT|nr:ATP-binding protein [Nannocystis bainbridge]MDC0721108.1 ATP-binding protein [Nannocystis bainbridge]
MALDSDALPSRSGRLHVLAGGGEMGARMREIDWAATPLGPVDAWPQSLKTCVRIILTSLQPMFVWWGDDLINLYNDAYKSIVGGKHPEALGQPASVVWREIWDQVGPRAASAMRLNEGTYDEALLLIMERYGYPEETYYTFSYSPVPNDQGGTGGIICANTDDTQRILGERQLALLRELAARTADARTWAEVCARGAASLQTNPKDLPFALIYIADADRRRVQLAGAAGLPPGHAGAPEFVSTLEDSVWPFAEALQGHERVVELPPVLKDIPSGAWPRPPTHAVALPISPSGETGRAGVLIVGLNPFRQLDDNYRGFLQLAAGQLAASIANALAYEEERRRAEALAELDRAKTIFFSNVSHEFRTPLTLMLGPLEDALSSAQRRLVGADLDTAYRNAVRLLKLVNVLLDFSRIEAGRIQASYEPTDLAALTTDLASAFRSAIERAGLVFTVDCPPLPEPIHVDHDMWEKIVLNLLSNALKFTFEGTIAVALRLHGDQLELAVSDTGTGIPEHELPHLFRRFHQVQGARSRTHEGSGIGLALVHELVRLHGGTLHVTSEVGVGTTFTVAIPRGHAHLPADRLGARRTQVSSATGAAPYVQEALRWLAGPQQDDDLGEDALGPASDPGLDAGPPARILLADDNADMRDYVGRVLQQRWIVEAVPDGAVALATALDRPPDLVLTDVMMPNLDGFGLLHALREDPRTRRIPVLMLSARAGEESRIEGLEAGADDYLVKPFSARELVARVATHLQIARLRAVAEHERAKLYDLFMQAPVPIAVFVGPEHRYEVANPPICEMLGRPELVGKTMREAFPEIGEHAVIASLDAVLATGEPVHVFELNIPLLRHGAIRDAYFNYVAQPIRDPSGAVTGAMVVAFEVTEQVLARHRVERLSEELALSNKELDQYAYVASHDLKAPLRGIASLSQWIEEALGDKLDEESQTHMHLLRRRVFRLETLIDGILHYSRAGRVRVDATTVDTGQLLAEVVELLSPPPSARISIAPGMPTLTTERIPLQQVFQNLIGNALKHAHRDDIQIAVTGRDAGQLYEFSIRDDGPGIAPEFHERIWGLFQTLESRDKFEGAGIGLSVVKKIVESRGGSVALESRPGAGATFLVRWPKRSG